MINFNHPVIKQFDVDAPRTDITRSSETGEITRIDTYFPDIPEGESAEGIDFLKFQNYHPQARIGEVIQQANYIPPLGNACLQAVGITHVTIADSRITHPNLPDIFFDPSQNSGTHPILITQRLGDIYTTQKVTAVMINNEPAPDTSR